MIEYITVPYWLSPSRFGQLLDCRLSVLGERQAEWLLPPSPAMIVGSVVHHVREQFLAGRWPPDVHPQTAIDQLLNAAISEAEQALVKAGDGPAMMVPLRRSLGRRALDIRKQRLRAWVQDDVTPTGQPAQEFELRLEPATPDGPTDSMAGPGHEPWLVAPGLRLRGRADRIDSLGPHHLLITEYKSGTPTRRGGSELDPSAALQVRLYGLMVEHVRDARVELRLVAERVHPVEWNPERGAETRSLLDSTLADLTAGAKLDARSLAAPGAACLKCRVRPGCARYLEAAPKLWRSDSLPDALPLDVWGTIEAVVPSATGWLLRLRAPNGHLATVGAPGELEVPEPGAELFVFEAQSAERRRPHGRIVHPRNFSVSDASPGRTSTVFSHVSTLTGTTRAAGQS